MKNTNKFWNFINSADGDSAELLLYDEIASSESWWSDVVTPKQFSRDLANLGDVSTIKLRINSPGGDVFAAAAIHNALRNHKATVTAYVDGLAASAASVVAMAADKVVMPKTAMMMIHNPSSFAWGDARDMRETADVLDKVRDTIIAAYEAKTGKTRAELINMLNAETWMTAQDALDMGFADEIDDQIAVTACMRGPLMIVNDLSFDVSRFKTIPAAILAGVGGEVKNNMSKPIIKNDAEEQPVVAETPAAGEELEQPAAETEEVIEQPAADAGTEEEITDPVALDRIRVKAIMDLARPGADKIISDAIANGSTVEATALQILQSEDVKKASALANRRADAPHVEPGNAALGRPDAKAVKTGLLTAAMNKIKGIKD